MRRDPNLHMVERVAEALGPLRERVVFLGGCATGLLLTDTAAPSIRSTKDVDVIVEVATRLAYHKIEQELVRLGFQHDTSEGAPLCRWTFDDLLLDVMPTDPELLGFSNRWYPEAVHHAVACELPSGLWIRLVTSPYFLATKLEAFFGRGRGDFFGSHDLEDFVAVMDGRPEVIKETLAASSELRQYLAKTLASLLGDPDFVYSLQGHLPPDPGSQGRLPMVLEMIGTLARM